MSDRHLRHLKRVVLCGPLFLEYAWTRDLKVDLKDGSSASVAVPPPGGRWVVFDAFSSDKRTGWRRIHSLGH
jgi:hypothetical protein